jgi:carboxyl-terminal processing protease
MSKTVKILLIGFGLLAMVLVFALGLSAGLAWPSIRQEVATLVEPEVAFSNSPPTLSSNTPTPTIAENPEEVMGPFWEAWEILHEDFVDQPLDDVQLVQGAIRGMVESLGDPHTSYMDPDEYLQANLPLDGEYEGIGAWVDTDAEYLTIISPMPDSPAEQAGLKAGDQIIAIDGEDMTGIDGNLVIRKVLGPAGTSIVLTIKREGTPEPFDVDITRASITIPSVESRMLDSDIGYVRLYTFGAQTTEDLRQALNTLGKEDPNGIILDLRGNGGGFLNTAVDVTSEFISEGIVLIERFGDGRVQQYDARSGGLATEIPMVVLINGGSASASEIVAGALQDNQRALLIGETSFGKGSVQNWVPLSDDQGAVRVTVARWYTPLDRQINEVGLEPDIVVLIEEEDFEQELDPQLEKAIEVLLDQIQN